MAAAYAAPCWPHRCRELVHLLPLIVSLATARRDRGAGLFADTLCVNYFFGLVLWLATRRNRRRAAAARRHIVYRAGMDRRSAVRLVFPLALGIGLASPSLFRVYAALTATSQRSLRTRSPFLHRSMYGARSCSGSAAWRDRTRGCGAAHIGVRWTPDYEAEIPGADEDDQLTPRMTGRQKASGSFTSRSRCVPCSRTRSRECRGSMRSYTASPHSPLGGFLLTTPSIAILIRSRSNRGILFMTLAGINFATHFQVWQARQPRSGTARHQLPYYLMVRPEVSRALPIPVVQRRTRICSRRYVTQHSIPFPWRPTQGMPRSITRMEPVLRAALAVFLGTLRRLFVVGGRRIKMYGLSFCTGRCIVS